MSTVDRNSPKEQMIALLQQQPDDSTYDELLRELAFAKVIERGLEDVEAGRVIADGGEAADRIMAIEMIADYISQDNPTAAVKTLEGIYNKVQLLERNPEIGFHFESVVHQEVRVLLYGHYRIAYQLTHDKDVYVLGVFHAALDIERYLKD